MTVLSLYVKSSKLYLYQNSKTLNNCCQQQCIVISHSWHQSYLMIFLHFSTLVSFLIEGSKNYAELQAVSIFPDCTRLSLKIKSQFRFRRY